MLRRHYYFVVGFILLNLNIASVLSITDQDIHSRRQINVKNRILGNIATGKFTPPEEKDPEFWYSLANQEVATRLSAVPNYDRAKNIIFFLGDGMSLSTVTAARIRKGQLKGNTGEEDSLSFEKFPWTGLSKVRTTTKHFNKNNFFICRYLIVLS